MNRNQGVSLIPQITVAKISVRIIEIIELKTDIIVHLYGLNSIYLGAPPIDRQDGGRALQRQLAVLEVVGREVELEAEDGRERPVVLLPEVVAADVTLASLKPKNWTCYSLDEKRKCMKTNDIR